MSICDIFTAITGMISTALRTGTPLPQITPSPLLDRFIVHQNGFNVVQNEEESDYGLPKVLTIDTLENEQYLCVLQNTLHDIDLTELFTDISVLGW